MAEETLSSQQVPAVWTRPGGDVEHLSWTTEDLDNVALASSPLHSGWVGGQVWVGQQSQAVKVLERLEAGSAPPLTALSL